MQKFAMENNLPETAFYVKKDDEYQNRWFTPTVVMDLCGHATLATAFVLFKFENHHGTLINFISPKSGPLSVKKHSDLLTLNFPVDIFERIEPFTELTNGFGVKPEETFKGELNYMLVYENENQIKEMIPKLNQIAKLNSVGVIITARGNNVDFVSRYFAPQSGINEDPVTGSTHTTLTPYWAKKLGKNLLTAIQLSERKGYLKCNYLDKRVESSGQAKLYLIGEVYTE